MKKIFSGDDARDMWHEINHAKNIADVRKAMYSIGCKLQELEEKVDKKAIKRNGVII